MAARKVTRIEDAPSRRPAATTPEARENQLISAAHDLAERQIREGTASAQVLTHFLKLGSSRERLEQERLAHENQLTQAKIKDLEERASVEALYRDALNAMSSYQGRETAPEMDDYDD